MHPFRRPFRSWRRGGVGVGLLGLSVLDCSPEREIFVTGPSSSSAPGGDIAVAGSAFQGVDAPAGGAPGAAPDVQACTSHADCSAGNVCSSNTCRACVANSGCDVACRTGFSAVIVERNGCAVCECVPPSNCSTDQDCKSGEVCYAGAQCQDGCSTPDCCFGNHCALPGCGPTLGQDCAAVGCPAGGTCFATCSQPRCACDGSSWQCSSDGVAGSGGACAWVCTSP